MTKSLRLYIAIEIVLVTTACVLAGLIVLVLSGKPTNLGWVIPPFSQPVSSPTAVAVLYVATPTRQATAVPSPTLTSTPVPTPGPLSLDEVFGVRNLLALQLDPTRLRTVIVTGDLAPSRSTDAMIRQHKDDFTLPISDTKEILAAGDLTLVNMEAPLVKECPLHTTGMKLCGRPGFVAALTAAGVDVVTLENNHIRNYGDPGLAETKTSLEQAKLAWVDRTMPVIKEVRGVKFGIIALNAVGEKVDRAKLVAQIQSLRTQVDVLILSVHWGAEYVSLPAPAPGIAPDSPIDLGHLAVDAGVDLVVGNHPHWVQAVEIYRGKLIAYSHGNFIFDQMWSLETRTGVIGRYTFYDRILVQVEYLPIQIEDYGKPKLLQGMEAQAVSEGMKAASQQLERQIAERAR